MIQPDRTYSIRLKDDSYRELHHCARELGMKNIGQYLLSLHYNRNRKAPKLNRYDEMAVLELRTCRQKMDDCYDYLHLIYLSKGIEVFPGAIEKWEELQQILKKIV